MPIPRLPVPLTAHFQCPTRRNFGLAGAVRCDRLGTLWAASVRLDDEAARALRALESAGMSRSEAIRSALIDSARRLRRSSELAAEVAALEADDDDRDEMLAVAGLMESLRASR